jgi:hypothetical protein
LPPSSPAGSDGSSQPSGQGEQGSSQSSDGEEGQSSASRGQTGRDTGAGNESQSGAEQRTAAGGEPAGGDGGPTKGADGASADNAAGGEDAADDIGREEAEQIAWRLQGDEEIDRSLEEFDELLGQEQEALARSGGTTAADEALGRAGGAGLPEAEAGDGDETADTGQTGGNVAGARGASCEVRERNFAGGVDEPAAAVEGCEDDDRVARQLCEAATEERDPFLRAALWDEYEEYLKIVARQ